VLDVAGGNGGLADGLVPHEDELDRLQLGRHLIEKCHGSTKSGRMMMMLA
jgi:hypothetical protein